jgi:hypothetical protein
LREYQKENTKMLEIKLLEVQLNDHMSEHVGSFYQGETYTVGRGKDRNHKIAEPEITKKDFEHIGGMSCEERSKIMENARREVYMTTGNENSPKYREIHEAVEDLPKLDGYRKAMISREHLTFRDDGLELYVIDTSSGGTYRNGKQLPKGEEVTVNNGDRFYLAAKEDYAYQLQVEFEGERDLPEPERPILEEIQEELIEFLMGLNLDEQIGMFKTIFKRMEHMK